MKILLLFNLFLITVGSDDVTTVTGYRGRSVQIKCPYESGYEKNNKYLCRGECPIRPAIKDIPVNSGSPAKDTRFSLYDDTTTKIFTVTITDLRTEDKNTYWCGVERGWLITDIYTKLQLQVKTDDPVNSTDSSTTHSTSTHAMNPSVHVEITQSSSSTSTAEAPPLNDANVASESQKNSNPTIIIAVSVVLVLMLIVLLFAVTLQKKKIKAAPRPEQFPNSSSNLHMDSCPVYENEDSRRLSNSFYSTVQLSSSSSKIYSNTELQTDPSATIYTEVNHPERQEIYSTAQLPSDSSVSAAQSSDD